MLYQTGERRRGIWDVGDYWGWGCAKSAVLFVLCKVQEGESKCKSRSMSAHFLPFVWCLANVVNTSLGPCCPELDMHRVGVKIT